VAELTVFSRYRQLTFLRDPAGAGALEHSSFPVLFGKPPELEPAGLFLRMQVHFEFWWAHRQEVGAASLGGREIALIDKLSI
jgi:hypothetical protein